MADDMTIKLLGGEELLANLHEFSKKTGHELPDPLHAGAKIILDEIKRRVSDLSGNLKDVIIQVTLKEAAREVSVGIGPKKGKGWYWNWLEYGVDPHTVKRKKGHQAMEVVYQQEFRASMEHPGSTPKPFVRPAFDATYERALAKIGQVLGQRLGL